MSMTNHNPTPPHPSMKEHDCEHSWRQVPTDDGEAMLNCEKCGIIEEITQETPTPQEHEHSSEKKHQYKILWDYGAYEGMKLGGEKG